MMHTFICLKGADFINRLLYYSQLVLFFSLFWIALFERFTLSVIISAPFVGIISLYLSEKFLQKNSFYEQYPFCFFRALQYGVFLLFQIIRSAFMLIPIIFSGKADPKIIEISTSLNSDFLISVLANSITLTPGTITVDVRGQKLWVLWVAPKTLDTTLAGEMIKGALEKRLERGL